MAYTLIYEPYVGVAHCATRILRQPLFYNAVSFVNMVF
jgi:hypothetical protein